jgi:hypothetical protein
MQSDIITSASVHNNFTAACRQDTILNKGRDQSLHDEYVLAITYSEWPIYMEQLIGLL